MLLDELLNFAFDEGFGFVFNILHKNTSALLCRFAGMHLDSSPAALQHVYPLLAVHSPRLATCKRKNNKLEKAKRFNKGNKHDETTKDKAVARLCSVAVKSMGVLAS